MKAMQMVDRFLSRKHSSVEQYLNNGRQFQLVVVTALYITIKVNESFIAIGSDMLAELCCGMYTQDEIESMELAILHGLQVSITNIIFNHFNPTTISSHMYVAYVHVSLFSGASSHQQVIRLHTTFFC